MKLRIERLTSRDVPDNVALAAAVGWKDVESDWRVLHAAAIVLGIHEEHRLIAQGALGTYGTAGTIAKMIIAPDFQRRYIGSRLLDALLEEADRQSIGVLGLVATDLGRPLYQQRRFSCVGEVVILVGTPCVPGATPIAKPLTNPDAAVSVEQLWIPCSRVRMIHARFREALATSFESEPDGSAWLRHGDDAEQSVARRTGDRCNRGRRSCARKFHFPRGTRAGANRRARRTAGIPPVAA
jgi:GNAT superfamily N-acetyltransferase